MRIIKQICKWLIFNELYTDLFHVEQDLLNIKISVEISKKSNNNIKTS
ncbi:MAG: hypothetical protein JWP81_4730 [Ferruginibacter sp.]|nr:hypothetical protein [Ferruginibacter sp.]